jgi:hypothetical protein
MPSEIALEHVARRPSPRCITSAPLFKFVVAIVGARRRRHGRQSRCHCLRRSWHHVEGSQKIAPQTPIDVDSGDECAHPKTA